MAEVVRTELETQIQNVAYLRHMAQHAKAAHIEARVAWENENRVIIETANNLAQRVTEAEDALRELTLKAYAETGNKSPAPGVSVKIFKRLNYDSKEAMEWAKKSGLALKLDVGNFEKLAQIENLPFVEITEEPRAQIATTLPVEEMTPLPEEK